MQVSPWISQNLHLKSNHFQPSNPEQSRSPTIIIFEFHPIRGQFHLRRVQNVPTGNDICKSHGLERLWLGLSAHWDLLGQTPFKRHYFWHNLGQIMRLSLSSSQFEQSRNKFNTGAFDSTFTKTCSNCYKMSETSYCSHSSDWIPVSLLKISRLWGSAFIACSAIHKSCSSWRHKWTDQAPQHWMSASNLFFQRSSIKKFFFRQKNTGIGFWRWIVQRLPKMQWLWPVGDESSALQWPCRCWAV